MSAFSSHLRLSHLRLSHLPLFLLIATGAFLLAASSGWLPPVRFVRLFTYPHYYILPFSSAVLMVILCIYYRVLKQHPGIYIMAWLALCMLLVFMIHKPVWHYQYDYPQNTGTVEYYAKHWTLPAHNEAGEGHQAPLYYALAALVFAAANNFLPVQASLLVVQDLNFFLFAMFLLYSIITMLRFIPSRVLAVTGIVLLLAWPSNVMHSSRISNNIIIYLCMVGCAYHFLLWHSEKRLRELNIALIWMGTAFATQTSAIALLAATVTLTLMHRLQNVTPSQWVRSVLAFRPSPGAVRAVRLGLLLVIAGIAVSYGRNAYYSLQNPDVSLIFGRPSYKTVFLPSELFTLNLTDYVAYPYIITNLEQKPLNDQFWSYFLRSMSFGQYVWFGHTQAVIMNCLLLMMWVFMAGALLYQRFIRKLPCGVAGFYGVFLGYCIIAMASAKMLLYDSSPFWADVRYIYAIIPFFLIIYLAMLDYLRPIHRLAALSGYAMLAAYGGCAFIHLYLQLAPMW